MAFSRAQIGDTEVQIADYLQVSVASLYNFRRLHPSFLAAVKLGKEIYDSQVEQMLGQRACGFVTYEDVISKDETVVRLEKKMPPDTAAAIFWLKNRRPREWKDQPIEVNHNVSLPKALEEAFERVYGSQAKVLVEPTTDAEIVQEAEAGWGEIWGIREDAERRPQGIE